MDKYVNKWKKSNDKRPRVEAELSDVDIIGDPGLRKPIDSYVVGIRDELRRRYLAKGPHQPHDFDFPKTFMSGQNRKFQSSWFESHDWLEYSIHKDAAYCLYCYLFAKGHISGGDDAFTNVGFRNWKKATERFGKHEGDLTSAHHYSKTKCVAYSDQRHSVDYLLSHKSKEMEIDYRVRLTAVVDVVRLLLEQGLAFRGHDESDNSMQQGNFLAILKWYSERNEKVNKVMKSNAPGNNQLTSPKIQKDIINACATEVRKVIVKEIGNKFFALLIDESRDSSIKEQMAVVVRFVNDRGDVIERFLGVVHVSDTSAQSLKNAIDNFFAKIGLSLSRLRGQGYDGASNMRGELNGLKALILNENKHAYYIHCFAHQLQLVVVATSKEHGLVSDFFDHLVMMVNLVGASCKRKDALRQNHYEDLSRRIESGEIVTGKGKNQETSISRPGDTRWGSHYKTITRVLEMWNAVKDVLETICEDCTDHKSRGTASGLVSRMMTFEFVFIAHLMAKVLSKTSSLSEALQQKNQNIGNAIVLITEVTDDLKKYRGDDGWENLLKIVTTFCSVNDIDVPKMEDPMPGRLRSQREVDGRPKTYLHYFRRDIFFQVIDLILQEMNNRFPESSSDVLMCIACLDPRESFSRFDHEKLLHLAELYPDDFHASDIKFKLVEELNQYHSVVTTKERAFFSGLQSIGDLAKKLVERKWYTTWKLVYRLIELALVLPVSTATVERSFSKMKIVKNDLRNKMGDEFLTDSLLCYIEKEVFVKIENEVILQRFQNMATRRLQLSSV